MTSEDPTAERLLQESQAMLRRLRGNVTWPVTGTDTSGLFIVSVGPQNTVEALTISQQAANYNAPQLVTCILEAFSAASHEVLRASLEGFATSPDNGGTPQHDSETADNSWGPQLLDPSQLTKEVMAKVEASNDPDEALLSFMQRGNHLISQLADSFSSQASATHEFSTPTRNAKAVVSAAGEPQSLELRPAWVNVTNPNIIAREALSAIQGAQKIARDAQAQQLNGLNESIMSLITGPNSHRPATGRQS